MVLLAFPC